MNQLNSRETSDMDIDDESFDPTDQHAKSSIVSSHSFLSSNSDTVSVKSVNELLLNDDEYSQECYTDEECYLYGELYEDDSGVSCAINKPDTHPDEESLMEDMSIDDERQECKPLRTDSPTYSYCSFLETKESNNPTKPTDATTSVKKDCPRHKRLYQK